MGAMSAGVSRIFDEFLISLTFMRFTSIKVYFIKYENQPIYEMLCVFIKINIAIYMKR